MKTTLKPNLLAAALVCALAFTSARAADIPPIAGRNGVHHRAALRAEPLVITLPVIEKERYFSVQLIDLYTFDFDYMGSRTTGNDGGRLRAGLVDETSFTTLPYKELLHAEARSNRCTGHSLRHTGVASLGRRTDRPCDPSGDHHAGQA